MGSDFHTFHVHGHRWLGADGVPRDTQTVGPAESFRFRWREEDPGTWLYHCHVEDHMMRGMIGIYRVSRAMRRARSLGALAAIAAVRAPRRAAAAARRARDRRRSSRRSRPSQRRRPARRDRRVDERQRPRATPSPPTTGSFDSGELLPGDRFAWQFDEPGAFAYHCTIHAGMVGEVDVRRVILGLLPTAAMPAGDRVEFSGRTADARPAGRDPAQRRRRRASRRSRSAVAAADGTWSTHG